MVLLHDIVHVVVDIGAEGSACLTVMQMIEHLGRITDHGVRATEARTLIRLDIHRNHIVERAVTLVHIHEVIIAVECQTVHYRVLVRIITHYLERLQLGEHTERIERIFLLGRVGIDEELRHIHRINELRIAVTYYLMVNLVYMVQHIIEDT